MLVWGRSNFGVLQGRPEGEWLDYSLLGGGNANAASSQENNVVPLRTSCHLCCTFGIGGSIIEATLPSAGIL